ncbi:hypothetical protein H735_12485 [Vibrio owensii CAIM 1854 = LMG 25443]|uniref:Transposase n=1 Tax=Vibrio owensii CAIM 1854 = LMG 25443 TaxID=1229493 RepID=A0A0C1Z6V4_9VIBR|nr:hypothetical protein H735_12485 [Vibrio owensii CAIM 1854 = LMG 25443]
MANGWIEGARCWGGDFFDWYKHKHKHKHSGIAARIMKLSDSVASLPTCSIASSRQTKDWSYIDEVYLNPEKCTA